MLDKLQAIKERLDEVAKLLAQPDVMSDMKRYVALNKEYKEIEPIVEIYQTYKNITDNIASSKEMLKSEKDEELREMAREELIELESNKVELEEQIKLMLLPKDQADMKNALMEIRAGTGGDEASLFAGDLFRMYERFCEGMKWKIEVVDFTEGTVGGYKEIIFNVTGKGVYGLLKYESGVHRVQRVPDTETQGRVHTSAASVVVLPEADELDVDIKDADIRKDTFCSSGPGGQSVNTTYSAVRLTHIPTGIIATCQDQKSQLKNYDKALKVLRARIYEVEMQKRQEKETSMRRDMVSTGDRSAKIRTYNFPQGRLTDHRIGLTLYNLPEILHGNIGGIIEALRVADNAQRLQEGTASKSE